MAKNPTYSAVAKNSALNTALDVLNGGFMDFYGGGSGQPASPDVAVTDQTKAVRLTLNATAFAAAVGGSKTANAIGTAVIVNTVDVRWYRLLKSDETPVHDGTVGTIDQICDATVGTTAFAAGVTASCPSLVISIP